MNKKAFISILLSLLNTWGLLSIQAVEIRIVFPPEGSTLNVGNQSFIAGCISPADASLSINGKSVKPYRTGSFIHMQSISEGRNVLEIRSGDHHQQHTFFLKSPQSAPSGPPAIKAVFPIAPAGVMTGVTFRLRCTAPAGSNPQVRVGEQTIKLQAEQNNNRNWSAPMRFYCALQELPVIFSATALPPVYAGTISAMSAPESFKFIGSLFEARARSAEGSGDTLFFPAPGDTLISDGYHGDYRTMKFNGKSCYIESRHLKPIKMSSQHTATHKPRDISQGFGPHPPKHKKRNRILIVIDAGHGGDDSGAVGPSGLKEKSVNLMQARLIERTLKNAGYRTLMTRNRDHTMPLYERVRLAYNKKADAFISVHYNSCPSHHDPRSNRHIATYAWNEIGHQLAEPVHAELVKISPARNAGVLNGNLAVCRNPAVPSILLELDFITAPEGEELIQSRAFQDQVSEAVLNGINRWCAK